MPAEQMRPPITASREDEISSRIDELRARYREIRGTSEHLCAPLSAEDCVVQSMPDASPAKWHLAHTTWFFETFVLAEALPERPPFHPEYGFLFNSYYNTVGERHPRPRRGMLTRPSLEDVYRYREAVDAAMLDAFGRELSRQLCDVVETGLNHEQQHQELILTDVKHLLSCNALRPAYSPDRREAADEPTEMRWIEYDGGLKSIGYDGGGFHFDNESPRHQVFLQPFSLSARPVTNGDYLQFMEDGGYDRPELWLSDGWDTVCREGWRAPLYWEERDGAWWTFSLSGMRPVAENEPACHVSYYEADALARWAGARLPTEAEWEIAAADLAIDGNFVESGGYHPGAAGRSEAGSGRPVQMFGDVWEWTASPYAAYPGYRPPAGALGEYNGKFMCNQMVLRGGSCATPGSHIRATYRNFFYPQLRWQFSGIRLARDGGS